MVSTASLSRERTSPCPYADGKRTAKDRSSKNPGEMAPPRQGAFRELCVFMRGGRMPYLGVFTYAPAEQSPSPRRTTVCGGGGTPAQSECRGFATGSKGLGHERIDLVEPLGHAIACGRKMVVRRTGGGTLRQGGSRCRSRRPSRFVPGRRWTL